MDVALNEVTFDGVGMELDATIVRKFCANSSNISGLLLNSSTSSKERANNPVSK